MRLIDADEVEKQIKQAFYWGGGLEHLQEQVRKMPTIETGIVKVGIDGKYGIIAQMYLPQDEGERAELIEAAVCHFLQMVKRKVRVSIASEARPDGLTEVGFCTGRIDKEAEG